MLPSWNRRRFSNKYDPEREKRLVWLKAKGKDDDKDEGIEGETLDLGEKPHLGKELDLSSDLTLDAIQKLMPNQVLDGLEDGILGSEDVFPLLLLASEKEGDLLKEEILETGKVVEKPQKGRSFADQLMALDTLFMQRWRFDDEKEFAKEVKELGWKGYADPEAWEDFRKKISRSFLENANPETVLRTTQEIEKHMQTLEEQMHVIENALKESFGTDAPVDILEEVLRDPKSQTSKRFWERADIEWESIDSTRKTQLTLCMRSALKAQEKRDYVGIRCSTKPGSSEDGSDGRSRARAEYTHRLSKSAETMRQFLDAKIREAAQSLHTRFKSGLRHQGWDLKKTDTLEREMISRFDVTLEEMGHVIANAAHPLERMLRTTEEHEDDVPDTGNKTYLSEAAQAVERLRDCAWMGAERKEFEEGLREETAKKALDAKEVIQWASENADLMNKLVKNIEEDPTLQKSLQAMWAGTYFPEDLQGQGTVQILTFIGDICARCKEGSVTAEDRRLLRYFSSTETKMRWSVFLRMNETHSSEEIFAATERMQANAGANTNHRRQEALKRLSEVQEHLLSRKELNHELCGAINAKKLLEIHMLRTEDMIRLATPKKNEREDKLKKIESLNDALTIIDALEQCDEELSSIDQRVVSCTADKFKELGGGEARGFYYYRDNKIYLNEDKLGANAETREHVLHHEHGHAILNILTRRTGLLSGILVHTYGKLEETVSGQEGTTSFDDLLEAQAEKWKVADQYDTFLEAVGGDKQRADQLYRHLLMDELLNRYASWIHGGRKQLETGSPSQKLFSALEKLGEEERRELAAASGEVELDIRAFETEDELMDTASDDGDAAATATAKETDPEVRDYNTEILEQQKIIINIREFMKTQPEYTGQLEPVVQTLESFLNGTRKIHKDGGDPGERLTVMDNRTKKILEEINRVKKERLDIANAPKTGREGWRKIFDHVQFMSIYDMINMVKSGAEDIQRIWKRRGESVQSSVGEMLTGWISDKVPYAGRLKHEYHRRSKDSEVEEIEQWKKAFKEVDSYELHEILAKTRNADQTRAIIELLSERGRLDWNDKGLWRTLNALSHYTMPEAACEEDDLLRDRWIQKLITDIWSDKDHYYNWRRQNDDNFESGKKQFTSVTDQLSNIQGGLAAELKSMLEKFVAARTNEESIPEEVNPQKYEEILHYSIRNGKMSMQDKLFYLVQGIRHGLLTIDRLRVMAGEKGEILNLFPFIDYFYGHNNSMHEITALGKRLEESGDPFKPGAKTTMWLHMELLRDKKAQERMSKALSGTRAEQIDHEDFPTLVSNMSYANINEMTGVLSGTRYKISYEAAKNAYTGFGTKFKILATLAELDSKGQARFTEKDAAEAAKSIAAYIHMDNTFTGNTTDGNNRIKLSWDQIHEPGPSTSGLNVKEYRDGNGGFIQDILSGFSSSIDWNAMKDGNLVKNELVRSKAEEKKETIISDEDNRKKRNFVAMGEFSRQLAKAIMTNPDILKGILRSHRNNFLEENFADTSKPDEKRHINVNGMRKYMDSRT